MAFETYNPSMMDHIGTIQEKGSAVVSNGQKDFTWTNKYTNVKSKRMSPMRGSELEDERQPVSQQKDSWLMWKFASDISANMRYVVGSENYYLVSVRPYKGSRNMVIIDTIKKDNE